MYIIDVFFTGLMLICLDGRSNCAASPEQGMARQNTAWVVKADGISEPCGWYSGEETELEIEFSDTDFRPPVDPLKLCHKTQSEYTCILPVGKICVLLSRASNARNQFTSSLRDLPMINEVDRRFLTIREGRLENPDYVPTSIYFPHGVIGAGPKWPSDAEPVLWFRSDGSTGAFPRALSDRLRVTYQEIDYLKLKFCNQSLPFLELTPLKNAAIIFRNRAEGGLIPDRIGEYEDLSYLLWYYRLGFWRDTSFMTCPSYTPANKDAILLRCVRDGKQSCASSTIPARDTIFWPPKLAPRF